MPQKIVHIDGDGVVVDAGLTDFDKEDLEEGGEAGSG